MQRVILASGAVLLALLWLGPLPELAEASFSAHMTLHMGVVAVAAPLIAAGLAGGRWDLARRYPALMSAIPLSVLELIVVWGWHTPVLHHAARTSTAGLIAEQSMFFGSALLVWMSAAGGDPARNGDRTGAGVFALLLTSTHMTLLGALIGLAPRTLYAHAAATAGRTSLDDQHLGGAIMLLVGGVVYLAGGLWLGARLLAERRTSAAPWRTT